MAEQGLAIGLNAIPLAINHGHKIKDPIQQKYLKARGKLPEEDFDVYDRRTMEEKGLVLRRRRDVGSDEEIVEVVRHKGEVLQRRPRRPNHGPRHASSDGKLRGRAAAAGAGAAAGAMVPYRSKRDYESDSEGSIPPRSRVRAKSTSGRSRRRRNRSSSSSSSNSSSMCSSTEDEKNVRHMQRKKWLTAGLASIATIHAASKIYSSIESHDKRVADVASGKMSPEEAHKKARASRWQDAAAIGIAALGIKGAMSEWHEVQEEHEQHKELMEKKEEHHKKRLEQERRRRAQDRGGYYKGRDGDWYYDGPQPQTSENYRGGGARYNDRRMIEDSNREAKLLEYHKDTGYRNPEKRYESITEFSEASRRSPSRRRRKLEKPEHTVGYFGVDSLEEVMDNI